MKPAPPLLTAARVEAYAASALRVLGWLLGMIFRLGPAGRGVRLKRTLSLVERAVERILFLKAVVRYGPPPRPRHHPRATPQGFRRVQAGRLRLFFRGAGVRARKAGALARVLALIDALANPERAIGYFLKHLCKRLHLSRLVPVAPTPWACAEGAAPAAAFADSS